MAILQGRLFSVAVEGLSNIRWTILYVQKRHLNNPHNSEFPSA